VRGSARGVVPDLADDDVLLILPHVRVVQEQDGFIDAYTHVTGGMTVRGNLVADAHLVAILFQNGVRTLCSNDRDFRKFESLEVRNPFE
jgi:predicted nucleic acid-binding protein